MVDTIRERILQEVVARMNDLVPTKAEKVIRLRSVIPNTDESGVIFVIDSDDNSKRHVRLAYEHRMPVLLRGFIRQNDDSKRATDLQNLFGEVKKKVQANEKWNNLAEETTIKDPNFADDDVSRPMAVFNQPIEILYYVDEADPFTLRVI